MIALPAVRMALAAALLAIAFLAGWTERGIRARNDELERSVEFEKRLKGAIDERDALALQLKTSDDNHAQALRKAQDETNLLRDRVSAGAVGLRIAAKCHAAATRVSEAASSAGLGDGAGAELDGTARQAYFALRDGIDRASAQLAACQGELMLRQ